MEHYLKSAEESLKAAGSTENGLTNAEAEKRLKQNVIEISGP